MCAVQRFNVTSRTPLRISLPTDSLVFDRFTVDAMPQNGCLWKIFFISAELTQRLDLRFACAVDDRKVFQRVKQKREPEKCARTPISYGFLRCAGFALRHLTPRAQSLRPLRVCTSRCERLQTLFGLAQPVR